MTSQDLLKAIMEAKTLYEAAKIAAESGVPGAKEALVMWAKMNGFKVSDANRAWKDCQPKKQSKDGILRSMHMWMADAQRTEFDVFMETVERGRQAESVSFIAYVGNRLEEWEMLARQFSRITGEKAPVRTIQGLNRAKAEQILNGTFDWIAHFEGTPWELAVRQAFGPHEEPESEPEAEEEDTSWYDEKKPYQDVKHAWETLRRELAKARPAKSRMHTDKVAHLGDDELTNAYKEAFQKHNKSNGRRNGRRS